MGTLNSDIQEWLESKQTSLWGEGYMVTATDSRQKAANWFQHQMTDFVLWRQKKYAPHLSPVTGDTTAWEAGAWDVVVA